MVKYFKYTTSNYFFQKYLKFVIGYFAKIPTAIHVVAMPRATKLLNVNKI